MVAADSHATVHISCTIARRTVPSESVVAPERCLLSKWGRWLGREITWKAIFRLSDFSYNIRGQFLDFVLSSPRLSLSHHHVNSHSVALSAVRSLWCVSPSRLLVMTAPSTCETGINPSVSCPWWADSRSQPPAGHIVTVAKLGRIYPLKPVSTSANWRSHWTDPSPDVTGQGGTGRWVLQRVSAYLNFHSWLQ